jgi:hypothetical protein
MPITGARLFATLVAVSLTLAEARAQSVTSTSRVASQTRATLDSLMLMFDRAWEPQKGTVDENLAVMDRLFVTDSTFLWITDGRQQTNRTQWLQNNRRSLEGTAARTDSIVHRVRWSTVHVLSENTVLHSSEYCADQWRKDGTTGVSEGTVSILFVKRGATWKIMAYHGSHRRRQQPLTTCPAN